MRAFFSKKVLVIIIAALLVAAITIVSINTAGNAGVLTNSLGAAMTPLRRVAASVANTFGSIYGYMNDYDNVVKENEKLNAQLAQLTMDVQDYTDVVAENNRLRALFDFTQRHKDLSYDQAMVTVISPTTTSNWSSSFTIRQGSSNSSVAVGDSVITENGFLVGWVSSVGTTSSTVTTVLDTTFSVDVLIGQKGSPGVVTGDFSLMSQGLCKINNITDDITVLAGDTIITSGIRGTYPKGLVIGNVESVQRNATGMDRFATVRPSVDFKNLSYVILITNFDATP